jgi:hypothetical protein
MWINPSRNHIIPKHIGIGLTGYELMRLEQERNEPSCSDEILRNSLAQKNAKSPGNQGFL